MAAPGWYGKLAMLGDFAHRRLPPDFVAACDDWLSHGIGASRASLGAAWLDHYLTAPLWCFAWSPGVVDARWWFGILMPSVDAVGRYFPLVVAFDAARAPADPQALARWARWYDRAGACALGTLRERATLDGFESALGDVGTPFAMSPSDTLPDCAFESEPPSRPVQGAWAEDKTALVLHALAADLARRTAWWTCSADRTPSCVTVLQGLPAAGRFGALLQGAL